MFVGMYYWQKKYDKKSVNKGIFLQILIFGTGVINKSTNNNNRIIETIFE